MRSEQEAREVLRREHDAEFGPRYTLLEPVDWIVRAMLAFANRPGDVSADLVGLRALLAKATKGPWFVALGGVCANECPSDASNVVCLEPDLIMAASLAKWGDNASLIVAAVNALPALLDEIERLRSDSPSPAVNAEPSIPAGQSGDALREALSDLVAVIDENGIFAADYPRVMEAARAALNDGASA